MTPKIDKGLVQEFVENTREQAEDFIFFSHIYHIYLIFSLYYRIGQLGKTVKGDENE